jgi:hypothetical protein
MKKPRFTALKILFFLFLLNSCGFEVIYKDHNLPNSLAYQLASIKIEKKRTQLDFELQNSLYNLLNPDKLDITPKYLLILKTDNYASSTYMTSTGASGRNRIIIHTTYTLKNLANNQVLSSGETTASDNYDVSSNRFGTTVVEDYVKNNVLQIISTNLRNALVNDFVQFAKKNQNHLKK